MPRRLRFFPPGSLVEITCRTVQGRLLLRPSPLLRDLTLGVLARASRLYSVEVHAFAFLSNHYHLLVTAADAQRLSRFMNYLNSNLAREAGRLAGWHEKFWGRRFQSILVADEEAAQTDRLRYVLAQGVKEGLVRSPLEWPGAHCARALVERTLVSGRWVDRTLESAARRKRQAVDSDTFVTVETLPLAPLPCWKHLPERDLQRRIRELVAEVEREGRRRESRTGEPPIGPERILRQDPDLAMSRLAKRPAPLAHAATKAAREALRKAYGIFVGAYRRAAERLRSGSLDVVFPEGAFPPALPYRAVPG